METSAVIAIIIVLIVITISLLGLCYVTGFYDSQVTTPPTSCDTLITPPFVPKYRKNDFSCREPVNIPGSVIRGTVQKCEAACDNILACVGFDRRSDVQDDKESFCYLQMSNCGENDTDVRLSPDQDGDKWQRHIK